MSGIWRYTAERWSADQADFYYDGIADSFEGIAAGLIMGLPISTRRNIQKYLFRSHAIYFRVSNNTVQIIRVLHQSMDERQHL